LVFVFYLLLKRNDVIYIIPIVAGTLASFLTIFYVLHEDSAMKKSNDKLSRFLRITGTTALIMFGILNFSGCGGSDDGNGDGDVSGTTGTIFNQDNTVSAAELAADTMSFFPAFSDLGQAVITLLAVADPNNSPFDLALCTNAGSSMLSWNDADNSGNLSAGDTTSFLFTNCDIDGIASGTINFAFTSVDLDLALPDSVGLTVSVNLNIIDATDTATFTANFGANWSTPNNSDFSYSYTAADLPDQKLTVSENGVTLYQFGCFNVTQTYNTGDPAGTYILTPDGIMNTDNKIMSLLGDTPLSFVNDEMESGIKHLWGVSMPISCTALGVPSTGVSGDNGSYILMEGLGGGNIRLHTLDATGAEFFTVDTTWDLLTD
jgi:hypothetical protein